jgi:hypothetical protein
MMTSKRVSWFAGADYGAQPQHAWCLDAAGITAGERESSRDESPRAASCDDAVAFMNDTGRRAGAARSSHGAVVGILSDRDLAAQANTPGPIDLWPREQSAAHDRAVVKSLHECGIALRKRSARTGSHLPLSDLSKTPDVESSGELRHADEWAEPLPDWMRTMRPSQTGMFMPGLLIALAALGAANGILSTVLALTWL